MCFSATASFSTSAILLVSGLVGSVCAWRHDKRFVPFNILLLFFGFQQFCEGMIWINSPFLLPTTWGMIFLFFALFVYPWFLSLCLYAITENRVLKRKITWIIYLGIVFGALLYAGQLQVPDLGADKCVLHIQYHSYFFGQKYLSATTTALIDYIGIIVYIFFTSAAFFFSDIPRKFLYGCVVILATALCIIFYNDYFISIWCFYATFVALAVILSTTRRAIINKCRKEM